MLEGKEILIYKSRNSSYLSYPSVCFQNVHDCIYFLYHSLKQKQKFCDDDDDDKFDDYYDDDDDDDYYYLL